MDVETNGSVERQENGDVKRNSVSSGRRKGNQVGFGMCFSSVSRGMLVLLST
jgi:hypothetical protein